MRIRPLLRVLLACLVICAPIAPLRAAEEAGAAADVTAKFERAQELYKAKDYLAALPMFREVLDASGSPNARLYVARCLKALGKVAEAYDEMDRTAREAAQLAETQPKYGPTRDAATVQRAALEPLVGKLIIALPEPPANAEVTLNGRPVKLEQLGRPITLEVGDAVVAATAPGKKPTREQIGIVGGKVATVTVTLEDAGPERTPLPPPSHGEPSGGTVRIAGFVVAGLGVAGMAVFGITGAMAQDKLDTLDEECGGVRCTEPSYADTVDEGKTLQTVANVSLAVGAVGIVAGAFMIIFGGPSEPEDVSIGVTPGGGALRWRF